MLTMSYATALVVRDQVPSDETNLHTCMCVLILTKRDGTLFDTTSILEEDIIKICIQLGHTHPMGVLHYTATDSIILFQLPDDMQHAICGAIKAMPLHMETITIRASAPSAAYVRAYMAVVGGEPSRPQPPPSEGEEEVHLATGNPSQVGELHNVSKQTLGTLADDKLHQLMEDLCQEAALCELNVPPRILH